MAKAEAKIKSLSLTELLEYMNAVELVCDFYDNEAKANTGKYDGTEGKLYDAANAAFNKYLSIREKIFNEVKNRVDELC